MIQDLGHIDISDDDDEDMMPSSSQATEPPSSQADIVISSDDDDDKTAATPRKKAPSRRAYSPLPPSSPPPVQIELSDTDSDEELPDADDLLSYIQSRPITPRKSTSVSPRKRGLSSATLSDNEGQPHASSSSQLPRKRSRKSAADLERDQEDKERKEAEKAEKAAQKAAKTREAEMAARQKRDKAARDKQEKLLAKERADADKDREKREKKLAKEQEKAAHQKHVNANRLVTSKSDTLASATVVFSKGFEDTQRFAGVFSAFRRHEQVLKLPPRFKFSGLLFKDTYDTISFEREWNKRFDAVERIWKHLDAPEDKSECAAVLYMSIADLIANHKRRAFPRLVAEFRDKFELKLARDKMFLMLHGTVNAANQRDIERATAALQVSHNVHILQPSNDKDAGQKLYDLTADLGIRPYKLIERSHLPFCGNVKGKMASEPREILPLMVGQIYRVTDSAAKNVAKEVRTLNGLYERYQRQPNQRMRELELESVPVGKKVDGSATNALLNQAISTRIHTVLNSVDPLQIVVKDHD